MLHHKTKNPKKDLIRAIIRQAVLDAVSFNRKINKGITLNREQLQQFQSSLDYIFNTDRQDFKVHNNLVGSDPSIVREKVLYYLYKNK